MTDTVNGSHSEPSDNDPLRFYARTRKITPEPEFPKFLRSTLFVILGGVLLMGGIGIYWGIHNSTTSLSNGSSSFLSNSADRVPQFKSNDQKARLSAVFVISLGNGEFVVSNHGRQTKVRFDADVKVIKKGETYSLEDFQKITDDYLKKVQFGSSSLYIPPDAFAHIIGGLPDLKVGSIVNIIPTFDSPDGAEAKAATILILR